MKTVLLIDDHPVIAVGITLALAGSDQFELAGIVTDPANVIADLEACRPHALIIDLVFDGVLRLSLIAECRAALPDAAIVVFSSLPARHYALQATEAGADAFVSKATDLKELLRLLAGIVPCAAARTPGAVPASDKGLSSSLSLDGVYLTPRETEIARSLGRGLSIIAIARGIGISANTVAVHRDNIRRKLDCRDTNELVARLARMDGSTDAPR